MSLLEYSNKNELIRKEKLIIAPIVVTDNRPRTINHSSLVDSNVVPTRGTVAPSPRSFIAIFRYRRKRGEVYMSVCVLCACARARVCKIPLYMQRMFLLSLAMRRSFSYSYPCQRKICHVNEQTSMYIYIYIYERYSNQKKSSIGRTSNEL